jgi:hypothetical protein
MCASPLFFVSSAVSLDIKHKFKAKILQEFLMAARADHETKAEVLVSEGSSVTAQVSCAEAGTARGS